MRCETCGKPDDGKMDGFAASFMCGECSEKSGSYTQIARTTQESFKRYPYNA